TASDLCELNRRAGRKRMRVDRDLRAVLAQAAALKRATGGTFNVAVEPLMLVWGFHRHRASAPTAAELVEAREAVLAAVVELDGDVARLPSAHTQLDFGAIGVGYGIDRALQLLRARGLRRAFIDVSGDMAAIGAPPGEPGWRVDIADPDRPGAGRAVATTRLRDAARAAAATTASIASRRSSIPSFFRALVTTIWSSSSSSALRSSAARRARAARASVSLFVSAASTGVSRSAKSSCIARSSSEGSRRMSSSQRTPASRARMSTWVMRSRNARRSVCEAFA